LAAVVLVWGPAEIYPAGPSSKPASRPASTQPAKCDPAVEQILDRLEQKKVADIETPIVFIKTEPILEDIQKYEGILRFKADKPNPRFLIRFDKFIQEGIPSYQKQWHAFDGQWYIEVQAKTKTINKYEIVRKGEHFDAFKIGQGPFPLPFGQKKKDILRNCSVKLIKPDPKKDPPETDHLECTPLPGTELADRYGTVHFYIHKKLDLPVRVRTVEKQEGDEEGVEVEANFPPKKIKVNKGMSKEKLKPPEPRGYEIFTESLPPVGLKDKEE